jgi:prepilin-type processing-associated H-X9-DG protein
MKTAQTRPNKISPTVAFTLTELLTVMTIFSVLTALILPTLNTAKTKARSIVCLNNQRQLITALILYAQDHADRLPYNLGVSDTKRSVERRQFLNWANNVMSWELDPDNTNSSLLTVGGLGPYGGSSAEIYRCPADYVLSELQRSAGWTKRTRSISMNAMAGDAGEFTLSGTNVNNPSYRQYFSLSDLPSPSGIFLFIDEHPDSINDGYFLNKPETLEWTDLPASYHGGRTQLVFADGHTEQHRWIYPSTKPRLKPDAAQLPFRVPESEHADFYWLMYRTSQRSSAWTSSVRRQ